MTEQTRDPDACPNCGTLVTATLAYDVGAGPPGERESTHQSKTCPGCSALLRRNVGGAWMVDKLPSESVAGFPVSLVVRHADGHEDVREDFIVQPIPATGDELDIDGESWVIDEVRINTSTQPNRWTVVVERA